jgi:hypothetical protein
MIRGYLTSGSTDPGLRSAPCGLRKIGLSDRQAKLLAPNMPQLAAKNGDAPIPDIVVCGTDRRARPRRGGKGLKSQDNTLVLSAAIGGVDLHQTLRYVGTVSARFPLLTRHLRC